MKRAFGTKSKIATKTDNSDSTQVASICQPVPEWMPCKNVNNVRGLEGMHSLASLGTSDMDALVAVLVHAVSAANVCAVKAEGQAVDAASHV